MSNTKKERHDVSNAYTTAKVTGVFIGMVGRVLKSTLFNLLMFAVGFCIGASYISCRIHYYATSCSDIEYIKKIESKVNEIEALDAVYDCKEEELRQILKQFWMKMSHDSNAICDKPVLKYLVH